LLLFRLNLDCFWPRCAKLKFASRTESLPGTRDFLLSDSFYSTTLYFRAMSVPFQTETRASKRKRSSQSDLQNTHAFSQNSSLSISDRKRKKLSSLSQSQSTQLFQDIPIYSESSIPGDSEPIIKTPKSQIPVEISKETLSNPPLSSPLATRTPLLAKDNNIQLSQTTRGYIRKPDQRVSFACVTKWQNTQPNDHTSKYTLFSFYYLFIYYTNYLASSFYT